jgi:hypothetical protein
MRNRISLQNIPNKLTVPKQANYLDYASTLIHALHLFVSTPPYKLFALDGRQFELSDLSARPWQNPASALLILCRLSSWRALDRH